MQYFSAAAALAMVTGGFAEVAIAQPPQVRQFGVSAQLGGGRELTRRDVARFAEILELDAEQKAAAEVLHEPMRERVVAAQRDMRQAMEAARTDIEDGDLGAIREKMPAITRKNREAIDAIHKSYLDDLKALLTPAQADKWPSLERYRRRTAGLRGASISGANVDLVELLRSLKLDAGDRSKLGEMLNQYELELDRVLTERNAKDPDANADGIVVFDRETMEKRAKTAREHGLKLREINQSYARKIAAALPTEIGTKLDEKFKTESFRSIYRAGEVTRSLADANKLSDLSTDQREKLRGIADRYRKEARALNDRWAALQERAETAGKAGGLGGRGGGFLGGGEQPDPELLEARNARRDLDARAKSGINSILTPEQQAQLPKRSDGVKENTRVMGTPGAGGGMMIVTREEVTDDGDDGSEDGGGDELIIEHRTAPK